MGYKLFQKKKKKNHLIYEMTFKLLFSSLLFGKTELLLKICSVVMYY